jgi:tRNA (guanine-N7-)-methyltransferase
LGKNKLKHFAEMLVFDNVYQGNPGFKGHWREETFNNNHPITLELACGKGEYTTGMAERKFDGNYIGIDIKGARIYTGAKLALTKPLPNVRFIRAQIDHLPDYFDQQEIDEIWITFADPHIPKRSAKRRLTSPKFINIYRKFLKSGGTINLKTDSDLLYNYTLEIIEELKLNLIYHNNNIYAGELVDDRLSIKTFYESKHLADNRTIKYIKYQLD